MDIKIIPYNPELKNIWDEFVESSKNGTFLFKRDYMDYHSDRFHDNSLMIFRKDKLYSILPANLSKFSSNEGIEVKILYSHQGLTYGGLIMNEKCTAEGVLDIFEALKNYLIDSDIKKLIYKPIPYIYQIMPSEEDLYALFRQNAKLIVRNISSTISFTHPLRLHKDRREAVRRAQKNDLSVSQNHDFEKFWGILENNLMVTYGAKPVHSLDEMKKLTDIFPENIKLWGAYDKLGNMLGGVLLYYTKKCIHAQYISATPEGKKKGAIDLIIDTLIENTPKEDKIVNWLDLGTSNEDNGRFLNESLIYQKEGFGGRGVCYDTYEWLL